MGAQAGGREEVDPRQDVAVDSTMVEVNAAMKSIVEDWKEICGVLLQEQEGVENPTDEELRRFDRKRKDKRVSNKNGCRRPIRTAALGR